MKKHWILLLLAIVSLAASGCSFTTTADDSKIPQSRPAKWEHSGPAGFGGGGFRGR